MQFENWQVTDDGIQWNGGGFNRFFIARGKITDLRKNTAGIFYEWILLATEEDWLTQNDLFDLNYAFVYAIALFKLDFDYHVFDATLEEQYNQFDMEDDEDPDL